MCECVCLCACVALTGQSYFNAVLLAYVVYFSAKVIERGLKACKEVFTPGFKRVMEYVLAIGNYLNSGTAKGGCYGFKLASLPQVGRTNTELQ